MHREETADSAEVRLVRYATLGSLPVLALMSLSAHGEVRDAGLSSQRNAANVRPVYEDDFTTDGHFTTFGGPADVSSSSASGIMVGSGTGSAGDWSSSESLATGADGIRASRSA